MGEKRFSDGAPAHVSANVFESLALIGGHRDVGMEVETLEMGATWGADFDLGQTVGAANPLHLLSCSWSEGNSGLHRGRVDRS